MGQAKRKAAAIQEAEARLSQIDISRIAMAIRKLALSASGNLGTDCYMHSALCQVLLEDIGVPSTLAAGYAGWRVGNGDGDVLLHAPMPATPPQPGGFVYHVWLEIGHFIFDPTTYSLRHKRHQLDQMDGGKTTVEWCPDYLLEKMEKVSSFEEVARKHAGLFFYKKVPSVERIVFQSAPDLDPADVSAMRYIFSNPDLVVFGPNDAAGVTDKKEQGERI